MTYVMETLDGTGRKWKVDTIANLGSDSNCQIQLSDPCISERHCRLEVNDDRLLIKDLRSQHGTFLNGARVFEGQLQDGDLLTLGSIDLVVHDPRKTTTEFPAQTKSQSWAQQLSKMGQVALSNHPVLLLGPSGTGKDVLAKLLHQHSFRKHGPFLSVNCSALTETLVESELFGHVKGSFTGAINDRKGAFEAARGGTLFLDEIGDLPLSMQAKILRALENEEIRSVGSDRTVKTDVRIIAATHQNLISKIQDGQFRLDLYYRLNVLSVNVPSLKERAEDFDSLVYQFAKENRIGFSFNAIARLKKYDWPGNIRELKNFVCRASTLYPKSYLNEQQIEELLHLGSNRPGVAGPIAYLENQAAQLPSSQTNVIKEIEKQMIIKRLVANNGSQKRTAADLGMPKSTLHDKIKHYGINLKTIETAG